MASSRFLFSLVGLLILSVSIAEFEQDEKEYKEWREMWANLITGIEENPEYAEALQKMIEQEQEEVPPVYEIPFTCDVEVSDTRPTSVHELRPSDVQIVAALGDSITAGFGLRAQTLAGVIIEDRGESWSIGSDRQLDHGVITLANILKKFNRNLQGSSVCHRNAAHPYMNWFNVAVSGATSRNMVAQTNNLVHQLTEDENIDFYNDWKLITILIGGNDLCRWCFLPEFYLPENYAASIRDAIDIMQDLIPRAMVNLVVMLDVGVVNHVNHSPWCNNVHQGACPCALGNWTEQTGQVTDEYYYELKKIVNTGRWDQYDDFTVVLQTHMRDLYPDVLLSAGELPQDYFAPDCFHPARRGHQEMGYMLWQGMMTPVGQKPYKFFPHEITEYICPTPEHPYIFTNYNSPDYDPNDPPSDDPPSGSPATTSSSLLLTVGVAALIQAYL